MQTYKQKLSQKKINVMANSQKGRKQREMPFAILSPIRFIVQTITIFEQFSKLSKTTTVYTVELFTSSQLHQWLNIKTSAQKADSHFSQGDSFHVIMINFQSDVP